MILTDTPPMSRSTASSTSEHKRAPKKAVIYCRTACAEQHCQDGGKLAHQERRCRDYAAYHGHEVIRVFHDEGTSGNAIDRLGMNEMFDWLRHRQKGGDAVLILVDDLSRFARSIAAQDELRAALQSVRAELRSASPVRCT